MTLVVPVLVVFAFLHFQQFPRLMQEPNQSRCIFDAHLRRVESPCSNDERCDLRNHNIGRYVLYVVLVVSKQCIPALFLLSTYLLSVSTALLPNSDVQKR